MSETLKKLVWDGLTDTWSEVELSPEEIVQAETNAAAYAEQQAAAEAEAAQVAADRADAVAALVALGLTEAQIAALSK